MPPAKAALSCLKAGELAGLKPGGSSPRVSPPSRLTKRRPVGVMKEEPVLGARPGFGLQVNQHEVANLCGLTFVPPLGWGNPGQIYRDPRGLRFGGSILLREKFQSGVGNGRYLRSLGWYSHFGGRSNGSYDVIGDLKGLTG